MQEREKKPVAGQIKGFTMKLNIYEKKRIVKTYEADTYNLLFGVLEDVADAIKLDDLKEGTNVEIIKMAGKLVLESKDTVKGLMLDIFDGLTAEELRGASINEMAKVLVEVVRYTIDQLNLGAAKN